MSKSWFQILIKFSNNNVHGLFSSRCCGWSVLISLCVQHFAWLPIASVCISLTEGSLWLVEAAGVQSAIELMILLQPQPMTREGHCVNIPAPLLHSWAVFKMDVLHWRSEFLGWSSGCPYGNCLRMHTWLECLPVSFSIGISWKHFKINFFFSNPCLRKCV